MSPPPSYCNSYFFPPTPLATIPPPPTNNSNTPESELKKHSWEVQLAVMMKFAKLHSKGDSYKYLQVMNNFLRPHNNPIN